MKVPSFLRSWAGAYCLIAAWVPVFWFISWWRDSRQVLSFDFLALPWWAMLLFSSLVVHAWLVMVVYGVMISEKR